MLLKSRNTPCDSQNYVVDSELVAEAFIARLQTMADERARSLRALMFSVEMIEAPDFDVRAARI
ncbi:MAG: hypothetical protein QM648_01885 [Solirubrobacterales bacterium]